MLIEVKVKVNRVIGGKTKKLQETYLMDKETFTEAEQIVMVSLETGLELGEVDSYEIQSLRISPVKEVVNPDSGHEFTYIATLKCTYTTDSGEEKHMRYKIFLWADSIEQANRIASDFILQGYDMLLEGIKQVDYNYAE